MVINLIAMDLNKMIERAKSSPFQMKIFNFGLSRMIPFNRPHGFRVVEIKDESIRTKLPYKKINFNHIRGLHACALATLSEFTTGLMLLTKCNPKKYRIILQKLEIEYLYQGKCDAYAEFKFSENWLNEHVIIPLEKDESTIVDCEVKIIDDKQNHLTTAHVFWQLKEWSKVRTKVN